jgi:hypothetical protein
LLREAEGDGHAEDSAAEDGPGLWLRHKSSFQLPAFRCQLAWRIQFCDYAVVEGVG